MLREFVRVRQEETGFRRLFTDELFDLYVWYEDRTRARMIGFQLVYRSGLDEKALTWTERDGFLHTKVDDGDRKTNQSPILVQDGLFAYADVHRELSLRVADLEPDVRDFVMEKIESCADDGRIALR